MPIKLDREKIMQVARAEIGQAEQPPGSNWGGKIPAYLASVGITTPAPWCAAFTYWVYQQVMGNKTKESFGNPLPKTGYTPLVFNWAEKNEKIVEPDEAQTGDLVLFYFPSLGRVGHIGIVGVVKPNGGVWTIEGNTNDEGGREGYEVVRKYRRLSSRMIFVNPVKSAETDDGATVSSATRREKVSVKQQSESAAIAGLGVRVHTHPLPRCTGGTHHATCKGRGSEVNCAKISKDGISFCVCTHVKL